MDCKCGIFDISRLGILNEQRNNWQNVDSQHSGEGYMRDTMTARWLEIPWEYPDARAAIYMRTTENEI